MNDRSDAPIPVEEMQKAADIRTVANRGPDSARNDLAFTGTVYRMFDRGLISVDDDYSLLIAGGVVPGCRGSAHCRVEKRRDRLGEVTWTPAGDAGGGSGRIGG